MLMETGAQPLTEQLAARFAQRMFDGVSNTPSPAWAWVVSQFEIAEIERLVGVLAKQYYFLAMLPTIAAIGRPTKATLTAQCAPI
jgi:hypothetical protein